MVQLIKYELLKKWKEIVIFFAVMILINGVILIRFWGNEGQLYGVTFFFFFLMVFMFFLLFAVEVTSMYSKDMNRKEGYMLFMTPNSGYKIIGSKMITAILIGLVFVIFYLLLGAANFQLLGVEDKLKQVENIFEFIQIHFSLEIKIQYIFAILMEALIFVLQFILMIYAAITIRKSLLANKKFGGFFSVLIFIGLNIVLTKINSMILTGITDASGYHISVTDYATALPFIYWDIVIKIIIGIGLFLGTGYLLDKKVDL